MFVILVVFFTWSIRVFKDFSQKTQMMEMAVENEFYPPHVTLCKNGWFNYENNDNFMEWLDTKYPCSSNFRDYKNAVKSCLEGSSDDDLIQDILNYSDEQHLPIPILLSEKNSVVLDISAWSKVFHDKFGVCYTLKVQNRTR